MRGRYALFTLICFLFFSLTANSQVTIDYSSGVRDNLGSQYLMGYGFNNPGPYIVHGKVWVFYSSGSQVLWRTKQVEEGGDWSQEQILFSVPDDKRFSMVFDGTYFHFIYDQSNQGTLRYLRARPNRDGGLDQDPNIVIYQNNTWPIHLTTNLTVDNLGRPWVMATVISGDEIKPIALSSIDNTGGWVNRPGWPKDLEGPSSLDHHGRGNGVIQIEEGKILFVFRDEPRTRMSARLWTVDELDPDAEGELGPLENTRVGLRDATRTSLISPAEGIAMLNSRSSVARRDVTGEWTNVEPNNGIAARYWNSMSYVNGVVRLWDYSGTKIRYTETSNYGTTWGPVVEKWDAPGVVQVNASKTNKSHGTHHSVMWATGSDSFEPPFNLFMGIEGTVSPPSAPQLVSPLNDERGLALEVTLTWDESNNASSYDVQVSTQMDFSTTVVNENVTETFVEINSLEINTVYYWRVRGESRFGTSDWSGIWSFSTVGVLDAPELLSPANGTENLSTAPVLAWESMEDVDRYWLQVSTTSDFQTTFFDSDQINQSTYEINGLDYERTYYWRVSAINQFGTGPWSEVWNFKTRQAVPEPPVLVSPDDGVTDMLTILQVSWEALESATSYRLQVSKQSDFSSTIVNTGNLTNTTYEVSGLEHSTTYYWRVNASNASGTGNWSAVNSFTTIIERPESPVLLSPVFGSEAISTFPVLKWDSSARAETYRVVVATDNQFTNIVINLAELDSTQYTILDELDEFTTYYWRVNATNIGGTSDWSSVSNFTTDQAVPSAPVLVGPADETTDVTNATMLWNAVTTATGYRLQVSKNSDFSATAIDRNDITNTFFQATNLEKYTTYYWRVRGISRVGQGYWSEVWSYETGDIVSVEMIDHQIPYEFALGQNFPNPFNPVTSIQFALPTDAIVRLEVYNMLGQRIATLVDGEYHTAGTYQAMWDARDDAGREVSSGIYIYRISAGDFIETKKMTLMK